MTKRHFKNFSTKIKRLLKFYNFNIYIFLTFNICLISIMIVFSIFGCKINNNLTDKKPEIFRVATLKGPSTIGMAKLHYENKQLPSGIKVSYEIIGTPDALLAKILSNEVDMFTLPTNVAVKLYNKNKDIKLASIVGYNVLYLVSHDLEIKNWQDLKNKKINVTSKGSTPDVILRYLLSKNNLNYQKDVQIDYTLEQVELSQLIIAGKVNIAVLPEPFVTLVLNKDPKAKIIFDLGKEWEIIQNGLSLPMTCFATANKVSQLYPTYINEFLTSYQDSINWVNQNPKEASEIIEKLQIGIDKDTALKVIPRCNIKYKNAINAKNEINSYIKAILEFSPEDIGGKLPDENFYYQ